MEFLSRFRSVVALLAFSLFCIISIALKSTTFTFTFKGVGSAIISPFQKGYDGAQKGVHMLWAGFTELSDVRVELEKTRLRLQLMEKASEELQQIRNENNQLRQLLAMKPRLGYDSIPAVIISKDPDNWFRTIIINRGYDDGIRVNMPVIGYSGDQKAVIGKVIEVRGSVSRIIPIISPEMKLGVMLQESRYPGLLTGYSSNASFCRIDYVSRSAPVKSGEPVLTSGQEGIFPQGLIIGTVQKNLSYKTSSFQQILVKPMIDYDQLEQVFVIKMEPDKAVQELLKGAE